MSTTVSYKGSTIATVSNNTKTLLTEGKYLEDDLTLTDVSGGGAVLTTKNISANGTYNASSDSADGYSQVNVSVPNTYSASDEGKVVSNGALVAQSSDTVTTNDTYDTTLINSLTVNVSGGGGASAQDILLGLAPSGTATVSASANIPSGAMSGRQNLTELTVEFSGNYNIATRCINYCPSLTKIVIDYGETRQTTQCGEYAISSNNALEQLIIRGDMMSLEANACRSNTALKLVDIESAWNTNGFCGGNAFSGSSNLKKLILRQTGTPIAIRSTSLSGTGFAGANGAIAYVPSALISSYQSASNWSTLYNSGYVTFSALENSVYADIDWYKS